MLRAGIDVWDGVEPPRPPEPAPEPDHHQRWHEQRATPGMAGEVEAFLRHGAAPPCATEHRAGR